MKTGLVLEGGGLRGLYTVGVLDALSQKKLMADYIVGVSAGAGNGVSYVSGQKGRGKRVNLDYINDKRYLNMMNIFSGKSVFGFDFIYDEIPNNLDPFDREAFFNNPCEYKVGVTDINTGEAVYFSKEALRKDLKILQASCSVPVFTKPVEYDGRVFVDGGVAEPIPLAQAFKDGCDKAIVVLTRERDYIHPKQAGKLVYSHRLRKTPATVKLLNNQHKIYAEAQNDVRKAEREGKALVISPSEPLLIPFYETNNSVLEYAYNLGAADGLRAVETLKLERYLHLEE